MIPHKGTIYALYRDPLYESYRDRLYEVYSDLLQNMLPAKYGQRRSYGVSKIVTRLHASLNGFYELRLPL